MAVLKGSTVSGDLKVSGTIYGNISGNIAGCASCADKLNTDAGTNNQYAVYFSGGKPKAFTCKFGSAAWCNTSSFAAACHTHIANCITGGTKGQILYSDGAKGYWGNLSTTANSMADTVTACGPWKMSYGSAEYNSPTYLTSWDPGSKTLRKTKRDAVCVGCAGWADHARAVGYSHLRDYNIHLCGYGIMCCPQFKYCWCQMCFFIDGSPVFLIDGSIEIGVCAKHRYWDTVYYCCFMQAPFVITSGFHIFPSKEIVGFDGSGSDCICRPTNYLDNKGCVVRFDWLK